MNALYAYVMTLPQLALSSLAIGLVIGVGLSLLVVWAYRARARVQEETSLAIPAGITDVQVQELRDHGYSDREIADVVGVVALNVLTGAFNLLAGLTPETTS